MTRLAGIPPGRAGRLALLRRLAVAARAAELLDRKLRLLQAEERRCELRADRTGANWVSAMQEADLWLTRAGILGAQRAVRLASGATSARVEVSWTSSMGVRHPDSALCTFQEIGEHLWFGNAALPPAAVAHRAALRAAAADAVAQEALRLIRAEIATTRRRLRAIDNRWIPLLREKLRSVELLLAEAEHEEAVRLHRAARSYGRFTVSGATPQPSAGSKNEGRPQ